MSEEYTEVISEVKPEVPVISDLERIELAQLLRIAPNSLSAGGRESLEGLLAKFVQVRNTQMAMAIQENVELVKALPTINVAESMAALKELKVPLPDAISPQNYETYRFALERTRSRINEICMVASVRVSTINRIHKTLKRLGTYYSLGTAQDLREGEATAQIAGLEVVLAEAEGLYEAAKQAWYNICEQSKGLNELVKLYELEVSLAKD
jgi:hypothetical protein